MTNKQKILSVLGELTPEKFQYVTYAALIAEVVTFRNMMDTSTFQIEWMSLMYDDFAIEVEPIGLAERDCKGIRISHKYRVMSYD